MSPNKTRMEAEMNRMSEVPSSEQENAFLRFSHCSEHTSQPAYKSQSSKFRYGISRHHILLFLQTSQDNPFGKFSHENCLCQGCAAQGF